jgi:hypothetical protein
MWLQLDSFATRQEASTRVDGESRRLAMQEADTVLPLRVT